MGKKGKKGRFNQVVDIDINYSSNSIADGVSDASVSKLNLSKEKVSELQRIKAQLPSAPQSVRIEEDIARIPEDGPFRIVMVNVAFSATREQIEEFFLPLKPTKIKVVEEEGRFRGYCFIDFASKADLSLALDKNGTFFLTRKVNMRIADNQGDRDGGFRRGTAGGFDSKEGFGGRRGRGGDDIRRSDDSDYIDPLAWRRGVSRPIHSFTPAPREMNIAPLPRTESPEAFQRPIVKLAPRTKPIDNSEERVASRNSNIFGEAKPVDTAARDRELELKLSASKSTSFKTPTRILSHVNRDHPSTEINKPVIPITRQAEAANVNVWTQRKQQINPIAETI